MKALRWAVAAALVLGCSGQPADPKADRLAVGQSAIVAGSGPAHLRFEDKADGAFGIRLDLGTEVRCEADSESPLLRTTDIYDPAPKETVKVDYREVRVLVTNGPDKGRVGFVHRYELRPVTK